MSSHAHHASWLVQCVACGATAPEALNAEDDLGAVWAGDHADGTAMAVWLIRHRDHDLRLIFDTFDTFEPHETRWRR